MANTKIILTTYGNNEILKAMADGTTVNIVSMVYGDGGGVSYTPQLTQTSLIRQLGELRSITKRFENSDGFIYFDAVIPADEPAFVLRELGLIDDKGGLIAVGTVPDMSKPESDEGVEVSLPISMGFKTSTGEVMVINIGPGDEYATKTFVIDAIQSIKIINCGTF